ncbi:protein kinase [Candidatus Zixiibacteriota bacterium]
MDDHEHKDNKTETHILLTNGTMVQQYRIIGKIGAGGMGEVYLAEDSKLKRRVALKFLPSHLVTSKDVRTRFVREAQTIAKLNHPNIISIYDVSEFNGRPFYVMELIEGETLHYYCHDKPQPIDMIIEYAIQICQGLGEAHRAGIIHRDIKSANIAVDKQDRVRLLDFGLASLEGEDKLTKTGSTLGTVSYMSPEQVSGRVIDHRSDLFSLGIVLYELIAGQTPFKRDNEGSTLKAIIEDNPEPLTRYKSNVPEKLQEIISKLLEKDKEIRYQSAEGIIADLKRLMYDSQSTGYKRPAPKKPKKTGMIIGTASAAVVTIIALWFFTQQSYNSQNQINDNIPMIAVLPFENLGSPDDDYFADGMTDEITSRLAMIDGLGVISRTSSMKYKSSDKSLKEIGKELGVEYILEGTVRWSKVDTQAKVKITPQLIRVSDDRHMWADNYERALMEVFSVQADIAEKIVNQLGMTLVESDKASLAVQPTNNPEAYQLYLKVLNTVRRVEWYLWDPKDDIDSVVKLDPSFALAHALRSEIYSGLAFRAPATKYASIAYESAKKSLELQPGLSAGHLALGIYYNAVETDYKRALEEFSMARSEMHNNSELLDAIGYVQLRQGKSTEAQANKRKAVELDPLNPTRHSSLAYALAFTRNFEEAVKSIDRAISLEPDHIGYYHSKIELLISHYGDIEKLKPVVEKALKNCDTLKFVRENWELSYYLQELPWDSLVARNHLELRDSSTNDTSYYRSMHFMYTFTGDTVKAVIYADSVLDYFEKEYNDMPTNPYVNSYYGALLSQLGDCERAVELGIKGKELLSVEVCHF